MLTYTTSLVEAILPNKRSDTNYMNQRFLSNHKTRKETIQGLLKAMGQ